LILLYLFTVKLVFTRCDLNVTAQAWGRIKEVAVIWTFTAGGGQQPAKLFFGFCLITGVSDVE
jgi:hypothetical protein